MLIKVDFLHSLGHTWSCTYTCHSCSLQTVDETTLPNIRESNNTNYNPSFQLQNQGACQLKHFHQQQH